MEYESFFSSLDTHIQDELEKGNYVVLERIKHNDAYYEEVMTFSGVKFVRRKKDSAIDAKTAES